MDSGAPGIQVEIPQSGRAPETDYFLVKFLTKLMDSGSPGFQAEISHSGRAPETDNFP